MKTCPECGSNDGEWSYTQATESGVVQGRLRTNEVITVFFLGCNCCSETIQIVSCDEVVKLLNSQNGK